MPEFRESIRVGKVEWAVLEREDGSLEISDETQELRGRFRDGRTAALYLAMILASESSVRDLLTDTLERALALNEAVGEYDAAPFPPPLLARIRQAIGRYQVNCGARR